MNDIPTHTDDRTPRFRPKQTGVNKDGTPAILMVFWHPCSECGLIWGASLGYKNKDLSINKGMGVWFCEPCDPNRKVK